MRLVSITAINWVFNNSKAKGAKRLVLLALADRANDQGKCWPSYEDIARRCNMDRRYAMVCVQRLVDMGEVSISDRFKDTGDQDSNLYTIVGVVNHDSLGSEQEFTTPSEQGFTRVVNHDSPKPSFNHHIEPLNKEEEEIPPCPTTPREAYSHPLFKVILEITASTKQSGGILPPDKDYPYVYEHLLAIYDKAGQSIKDMRGLLRPAWIEWKKRDYQLTNPHWLDWALSGVIPEKKKTRAPKGIKNEGNIARYAREHGIDMED